MRKINKTIVKTLTFAILAALLSSCSENLPYQEYYSPFYIGLAVLALLVLIPVAGLLYINIRKVERLQALVEQRRNELETETSAFRTIIDSMPDLVFHLDKNLKYVRFNKSMENHFNIKERDALGKSDSEVLSLPADMIDKLDETNRKVINEGQIITLEEIIPDYTGREVIFETIRIPLIKNNEIAGLLGIAHDVTHYKDMEQELAAASNAKSAFLANMSHELRTPLNVIIGLTDLLAEEDGLSEQIRETLETVGNAGGTLLSIVNDILDISKIVSGKLVLVSKEYNLPGLLNNVTVLLTTYIGEKPVKFKLSIKEDLPYKLYGDELRVKQIMTNLLESVVEHTNNGMVELSVECERYRDNVWLDIIVKNTGDCIREENTAGLFAGGALLGLSISRQIAEMMGGTISTEGGYGNRSIYRVRIRQGVVDDAIIGAEVSEKLRAFNYGEAKRKTTRKLLRADLSHAGVLVVDDIKNNLDVAAKLMRKYNLKVDCLSGGRAAIERIREGIPVYNAIFMDHMMPDLDGIETVKRIRALDTEYAKNVPVIALTANAISGTEKLFLENGFQDFLSKPIDIMLLDTIINKWVRDRMPERQAAKGVVLKESKPASAGGRIGIDIQGLNYKKALAQYDGDTEIYLSVLRSFAACTPELLMKLKDVTELSLPNCVITAHGLKGSSANICAEQMRIDAAELEAAARKGDLNKFITLSGPFIAGMELLIENITAWLNAYDEKTEKPRLHAPERDVLDELCQSLKAYDMSGIDLAMDKLEGASYDTGADLVLWLREKLDIMEVDEVIARLSNDNT